MTEERQQLGRTDFRFRAIFDSAELGVAVSNRHREIVETNPAFRRMLGYTEEELRTMSFRGLTHPEDEQQTERLHNRLLDGEIDDYSWEKRYIRKNGSTLWASVTVSLLPWATADEWNSVAILQDITTRRLAEKRLAESEERYRALFDHNSDAVFSVDLKGIFTSANPACEKLSGYILDELQGSSFLPLLFQEDVGRVFEHFLAAARGEPQEYRLGLKRKDGERVELVVNNVPIIQAGVVEGVFGIAKDVTEAVRARRELRKSEVKFRRLFDANPWPMWVGDLDTFEFLEVNDAAASHYGYTRDELLALSLSDIRPPEDVPGLIADCARVEEGYRGRTLSRHLQKDGTPIDVQVSSHGIPFDGRRAAVIVAEDVTEKLRIERENAVLQSQLRQAERMEVVGQLAGGVAHDFNNLLFVIQANSRFVVDTLPADDGRVEDLQHVLDACERGANLVRQLLTFSRKEAIEPRPLNINNSIKSVETMLRRSLGARIDLTIDLDPSPPVVLMDSHQVEQILLNLVLNSRDALSHDGHVSIKTDTPHLSAGELKGAGQDGCPPGDYVRVSVADNGSGMTMEVQKKIFEPFFSTKERDKGTGLGLATVYGIVKQAGGYIQIDSEADLGTKIDVYLPVTPLLTETEPEGDRHAAPRGQGETILVAEDETAVGSAVARILSKNGYAVIKAGSGDEALRLFEEHDSHISLVLTDLNMPRMSGRELAERIRTRRSETKVLFMSGYSGDTNEQHQVVASGEILLQKPFTADHLLGQIRASLEPSSAQRLTGMPEA
jgi:PAS domain S-box-containing protein